MDEMKTKKPKLMNYGHSDEMQTPIIALNPLLPYLKKDWIIWEALTLDSSILTYHGWKDMKNIKINDLVIGKDGKPHKVINILPKGVQDVYKVTFDDGSFVKCTDEHLWQVATNTTRQRKIKDRVIPLREIRKNYYYGKKKQNRLYFIPIVNPVKFRLSKKIPLNPYLLGVLIGDGCLTRRQIRVTITEKEIYNNILNVIPKGLCLSYRGNYCYSFSHPNIGNKRIRDKGRFLKIPNKLAYSLNNLKLIGVNSKTKFIPDIYKFSSVNNRKKLLQGLIDTDGHINKIGTILYYTTSRKLAYDVKFIVHSLGGLAKIHYRPQKYDYKKKRNRLPIFELIIQLHRDIIPCRLKRKLKNYKQRKFKKGLSRSIKNIEYVGKEECQCIKIDSKDGLFVTNNFIVTHNCAWGKGNLAKGLKKLGFKVKGDTKHNFLERADMDYDCIVTNPPYSLKYEFLKKCYLLRKPFALLLPLTALEGKARGELYKEYGIQLIIPNKRINFETPSGKGSGSWFQVAWFTWGLNLPRDLNFVELK